MKKWVILSLLLLFLFSCKNQEVLFPTMMSYYIETEDLFDDLIATKDPDEFHQLTLQIISNLEKWEEEYLRLSEDKDPLSNDNINRDWRKMVRRSYQMISNSHVELYRYKREIVKPMYYEIQGTIEADIDNLALSVNRFLIQTYPLKDSEMAFYKNLPEITSRTADPDGTLYYIVKVNIGYLRDEKETQRVINESKLPMIDIVRSYCSQQTEQELLGWNEVDIKAGLMKEINDYIFLFHDFQHGKMEGVKVITFSKIQTFSFG